MGAGAALVAGETQPVVGFIIPEAAHVDKTSARIPTAMNVDKNTTTAYNNVCFFLVIKKQKLRKNTG